MSRHRVCVCAVVVILSFGGIAEAQSTPSGPPQDVEMVIGESQHEPERPLTVGDRPIYRGIQDWKKQLDDKFGISFAIEDTLIYQATSGGVNPNDAMVNTLGLFATWKIIRDKNGKDYGGIGFQFETRGDPLDDHFTDLRDDLGTLWSPNDSTSDDYAKINQLWWGQYLFEKRLGFQVGKIDPGSRINANRFAGSGNTQYFGQPFATNPARSFSDNGIGLQVRAAPTDWFYGHFMIADSDANSTYSPFKTIDGRWLYAAEAGFTPKIEGMGQGTYRFMLYQRDTKGGDEVGWALSFDQNLSDAYGVFLRYGGNDGGVNSIQHLVALGFSFLKPFDRPNDQAGIGVSYTHPDSPDLRDEYSSDVFYRLQVTEGFELSGDVQVIVDPSAASDQDVVAVFGVRARVLY